MPWKFGFPLNGAHSISYINFLASHKIFFSCICLVYNVLKDPLKLVKTLLRTQLKQTNLEIWLYISTKNLKEGFNATGFQHFCKCIYANEVTTSSSICGCYLIYLVAMLPFRMIFLYNVFCFILFPRQFAIF